MCFSKAQWPSGIQYLSWSLILYYLKNGSYQLIVPTPCICSVNYANTATFLARDSQQCKLYSTTNNNMIRWLCNSLWTVLSIKQSPSVSFLFVFSLIRVLVLARLAIVSVIWYCALVMHAFLDATFPIHLFDSAAIVYICVSAGTPCVLIPCSSCMASSILYSSYRC